MAGQACVALLNNDRAVSEIKDVLILHFKRGGTGLIAATKGDNNVDIPDMYPLVLSEEKQSLPTRDVVRTGDTTCSSTVSVSISDMRATMGKNLNIFFANYKSDHLMI